MPSGPARVRLDVGRKSRALELERLQLRGDGLVELCGRLLARLGQSRRGFCIDGIGLARRRFEPLQFLRARIERSEIGGMLGGKRREIVDRDIVFAARGAQRKQPLLDAVELVRIVIRGNERCVELRARVIERGQRRIERLHRRIDQRGRLRPTSLQPAQRGRQRGDRRALAGHRLMRIAQILRDLVGRHHGGALFGERALLAGFRLQPRELLDRMAQPVGLAPRLFDTRAMRRDRFLGAATYIPCARNRRRIVLEPRIGIEQAPMRRNIDERALVMLAMDLDQRAAERFQHLHAHRLVVDEGARAPVGKLHAAQDQAVLGSDAVFGEQCERRVARLDIECGRHLSLLGALPHQTGVAAAAERKREGIEQDRFAGAGLAGEHRKTSRIIDVEPFDQNDVADGEPGEHALNWCRLGVRAQERTRNNKHETRDFETARWLDPILIWIPGSRRATRMNAGATPARPS